MRRVIAILLLAMAVAGCQFVQKPIFVQSDVFYVGPDSGGCVPPSTYLVARLVITDDRRLVLQDNQGVMTSVTWRGGFNVRTTDDEVEILDGSTVIAKKGGGRYKIGGRWEPSFGFWACGDVMPEPG